MFHSNLNNNDPFSDPFFKNARMNAMMQQPLISQGQIYTPQIQIPGVQNNFHSVFITPPEIPEDQEYMKSLKEYEEQRDKLEKMEKNILELHKKAVEKQKMKNSQYSQQQQQWQNSPQQNYSTQTNYDSKSLAKDFSNLKGPSQYNQSMPYSKSTVHSENNQDQMNNSSKYSQNNNQMNNSRGGNLNYSNTRNNNSYRVQQPLNFSTNSYNNYENNNKNSSTYYDNDNLRASNQFLNVQQPTGQLRRSSFYESFEKTDTIINEKGEKVVTKKTETNQDGIKNIQVHEQIFNQQGQLVSDNIWNERPALQNEEKNSRNNTLNSIPMETSAQYKK